MTYSEEAVRRAVRHHLPGREVLEVRHRGLWIRYIYEVFLDGGETVFLKIRPDDRWGDPSEKEAYLSELLREHGLPAPRTLAFDGTGELLDQPFIIQEKVGGRPLSHWLEVLGGTEDGRDELARVYEALGRFFRRLHAIGYGRSGWIHDWGQVLELHPNDFMFKAVVRENGAEAVRQGRLDPALHRRVAKVFEANLEYLKDHRPSLVSATLPWTIHLEKEDGRWRVTKLTDMHDMLYWDPAENLSGIKYPAYASPDPRNWEAFLAAYGAPEPEEKRLRLYQVMQAITASIGMHYPPPTPANRAWQERCLDDLPALLDLIEAL